MSFQTDILPDTPAQVRTAPQTIARLARRNGLLLGLVVLHFAVAYAISRHFGIAFQSGTIPTLLTVFRHLVPSFVVVFVLWRFAVMALTVRPDRPIAWLARDLRATAADPERLAGGLLALLAIGVLAGSYAFLKDTIPLFDRFSWDPHFAALDRTLHGGADPYTLLMPLLGTPWATTAINGAYHGWFFLLYFLVFITAFDTDNPVRRNTFLIAFVLTWALGGNLLAILLSSAGPVYYEAMGFGSDFTPLVETLHRFHEVSPVWALEVHQTLLDGYLEDGPIRGISAMPSMHVASAVLMALCGFSYNRAIGWALTAFAVAIQLGSVHLAWHYAIDGYAGAAIAIGCWWLAARLARGTA